jgi:chorismate mutase-like protein
MVQAPTPEMKVFRAQIDEIDKKIAALLGQRFAIVDKVAHHKKEHGIPSVLPDRVEQVKDNAARLGAPYKLDEKFMRDLYTVIIDYACSFEDEVIDG